MEDRALQLKWQARLMPLARTPWDKKGGKALERYSRQLQGEIESMTPWVSGSRYASLIERKRAMDRGVEDPSLRQRQKKAVRESAELWASVRRKQPKTAG